MGNDLRTEKILVCYNKPFEIYSNYSGKDNIKQQANSESELQNEINDIVNAIKTNYSNVLLLEVGDNLSAEIDAINDLKPDLIVNLVESYKGNSKGEIYFASILELLNYKYTGNKPEALLNCLNKKISKLILNNSGIKTPNYLIINEFEELSSIQLTFPVIVKLMMEDASIGISENSVCNDLEELNKRTKYLFSNFSNQEVLIEEYIDGREFNVAIFNGHVLPISEICFDTLPSHLPKIVTYEAKWNEESEYFINTIPIRPAAITDELKEELTVISKTTYKALNCSDGVRVDIRLDKNNIPYVIEVNPNPDLTPKAGFAGSYIAQGKTYNDFFNELISNSLDGYAN